MDQIKLFGLIKTLVTEVHHAQRYGGKLSGRPNKLSLRARPDRQLQVAESGDGKKQYKAKTDTGGVVTVNLNPEINSQSEPTRGAPNPQTLDTK